MIFQNTGLLWEQAHHATRVDFSTAKSECESLGDGWRLPTIKELYTLADFTGSTLTGDYYLNDIFDFEPPDIDTRQRPRFQYDGPDLVQHHLRRTASGHG